jgi:hypothetical protein
MILHVRLNMQIEIRQVTDVSLVQFAQHFSCVQVPAGHYMIMPSRNTDTAGSEHCSMARPSEELGETEGEVNGAEVNR